MDLRPFVENLQQQLAASAEAVGPEARELIERLAQPLDAAIHLTLQDALAAAGEEITAELAPGSVELRIRGREPEFVVTVPTTEPAEPAPSPPPAPTTPADDDGGVSRINLRLPEQLKARAEAAASGEGLSLNSWLIRAVAAALDRPGGGTRLDPRRSPPGTQRYTGWAR